tara:strand:- start:2 stop:151 length:150 start_codon:yes stop_codon:yes gene_type:complete
MQVDESVSKEYIGKQQSNFLNWLQVKLEEEMEKPSFKNYKPQKKDKKNV